MGLGDGKIVSSHTRFGGTGRVYDGFLRYAGNETSLLQCPEPFRPHMSCGHEEDAVVRCGKSVKYKLSSTDHLSIFPCRCEQKPIRSLICHIYIIRRTHRIGTSIWSGVYSCRFQWPILLRKLTQYYLNAHCFSMGVLVIAGKLP